MFFFCLVCVVVVVLVFDVVVFRIDIFGGGGGIVWLGVFLVIVVRGLCLGDEMDFVGGILV